jgi:DNA-binding transcriptional MerR regulator
MKAYTVSDAAIALGVSASSIRNWTDNSIFEPFFSDSAARRGPFKNSGQREYTEDDLYVLNTISTHKSRTNDWEDVAAMLQGGYRNRDLPTSAALVLPENRAEVYTALTVAREQISTLETRINDLIGQIEAERQRREDDRVRSQSERDELHAKYQKDIERLNREVGEWKTRAELYKEMMENKDGLDDSSS